MFLFFTFQEFEHYRNNNILTFQKVPCSNKLIKARGAFDFIYCPYFLFTDTFNYLVINQFLLSFVAEITGYTGMEFPLKTSKFSSLKVRITFISVWPVYFIADRLTL